MTQPVASVKTNTLALVGFIVAFMVPIAGLVLGLLARKQLRVTGNQESGDGLAKWAVIIGVLGTLLQIAFFIVWLSLLLSALNGGLPRG